MSRKRNFHDDTVLQDPGGAGSGPGPRTVKKARFANSDAASKQTRDEVSAMDKVVEEELDLPSSRQAVRLDGYDSDSSAGSDADVPSKPKATANDEDEDMFTSGPEPVANAKDNRDKDDSDKIRDSGLDVKGGSNSKKYLDLGDIEGQEFGRTTDEQQQRAQDMDNDTDSQESFVEGDEHANDDEAPRSRRSKKGMGYVISRFNMKDEMEEGRFNAEGTFIANDADPYATHDAWLEDVSSKSAIKAAQRAKDKQERDAEAKDRKDREMARTRPEAIIALLESGLLDREKDESVTSALARLGATKKKLQQENRKAKQKAKRGQKALENASDVAMSTEDGSEASAHDTAVISITQQIDTLTTMASLLLDVHNETDIYDQTFMDLVKTLRLEGEVPRVCSFSRFCLLFERFLIHYYVRDGNLRYNHLPHLKPTSLQSPRKMRLERGAALSRDRQPIRLSRLKPLRTTANLCIDGPLNPWVLLLRDR